MGERGGKGKEKERCKAGGIACAKARMVMALWENSRELEYRRGRPIACMQAAASQCNGLGLEESLVSHTWASGGPRASERGISAEK